MKRANENSGWPTLTNYRIVREVARGGMGIVYEAEQLSLGRRVALKTLAADRNPGVDGEERFQLEARSASRLHHSNIVPVFEVGRENGTSYYAMQFIDGMGLDQVARRVCERMESTRAGSFKSRSTRPSAENSLADLLADSMLFEDLDSRGPTARPVETKGVSTYPDSAESTCTTSVEGVHDSSFGLAPAFQGDISAVRNPDEPKIISDSASFRSYCSKVAKIGIQVASGLDHAHRRGLIHRDIKPSNLLLDPNGTVWITDFGLATSGDSGLTQTGHVVGTLRFISPERFSGHCDGRADIYALGLTLYEMLSFRPAFEATDRAHLLERIRTSRPIGLRRIDPRIPADLETIIGKAIDSDPQRRYASANELSDDLQRFVENRPIRARRISPVERLIRWTQRNRVVAALLFSLLVGLAALTTVSLIAANSFRIQANTERVRADTEARLRGEEQQGRQLAENVRDFIVQSFGNPNLDQDGRTITVYDVLKREVDGVLTSYHDDRLTQAVLLQAIGDSFESLSEYPDAIQVLQMSLEIFQEILGDADRRTIDAMSSLVNVYVSNQQGAEAIELSERILELVTLHYPDDEEYVLAAENNLGSAYFANGDDLQAAPIFESVLQRMRTLHGDGDQNTMDSMYNLIQVYHWLSRREEERALADELLRLSEGQFAPDSLEVAKAKEVVAEALPDHESDVELRLRQEIHDVRRAQLGETHSRTLDAISNLASSHLQTGNTAEGLRLKQTHYDRCLEKYGELHRATVASATGLARALADSGDELGAIEWLERALAIGRQIDPESDPNLLNTKQGLAYYCYKNGDPERARELYRDIFENGFESTGFQTTRTKLALQSSIVIGHELRDLEGTESSARNFYELVSAQDDPAGWEVVGANAALAAVLYDLGRYDEALAYANAAIGVSLEGDGFPRGVVRSRMIRGLILIRQNEGHSAEGEQLLEDGFAEFRAELPQMSALAHWMAKRSCERAIAIYEEMDLPERVAVWTDRIASVDQEIEALRQ